MVTKSTGCEIVKPNAGLELLAVALPQLGYKILLRDYECELGRVAFITKKAGKLWFFFVCGREAVPRVITEYYTRRYGTEAISTVTVII